jgi:histidinol-phosphate phosphatase family protein
LFLDRDGVIIVDRHYLDDPADVQLEAGVPAALRRARASGYRLVGLSNQSGLGRGLFDLATFAAVMARLDALLRAEGCALDAFFYCPHAPADACACRKPAPGLLREAAREMDWEPERSAMVGDKLADVDLALDGGLQPILVRTGHGAGAEASLGGRVGVPVCDDLAAAVAWLLGGAA